MPQKIIIVRHGETDYNRERRMQGWLDIPLNEAGHTQAKQAAESLSESVHAIYSSDLRRAVETASYFASKLSLPVSKEFALRERDMGIFANWAWETERDEAKDALWPEFERARDEEILDWAKHGGESIGDMIKRIGGFLDALPTLHAGQTVLLVTHGGTINRILEHYQVKKAAEGYRSHGNASINILVKTTTGYVLN